MLVLPPADYELIPLHNHSKIPHEGWNTATPIGVVEAERILRQGGNYGVRMRDTDVVIDVDPRNGGSEEMLSDLPMCPRVLTPSGGLHLYFTKPAKLDIRETIKKWLGIEFKTKGRQVVGPYSIHPDFPGGPRYQWDILSGPFPAPPLPAHILKQIAVKRVANSSNGHGEWTVEMLEQALAQLDATQFDTNDKWFPLMCAAHAATHGAGYDAFLQWSMTDEMFAQDSGIIRARWESLRNDKSLIAGPGTLKHILLEHGVTQLDFDVTEFVGVSSEDIGDDRKPVIKIHGGALAENIVKAERELGKASLAQPAIGVFQRGGMMIRLARVAATTEHRGIERQAGTLQMLPVNSDVLRMKLCECITWARFDERKKKWVKTDAPVPVAKTLTDLPGLWPHVPILNGVVESPALRMDGTLLDAPGYDGKSLFFDPGATIFPQIPKEPTKADARAALDKLLYIVKGFPFVDEASKSVAIAMMMTSLCRFAVRAAPMFIVSAPKMGSGKTLLAHLPSYIANGRPPSLMSQPDSPDEERKRLLALLSEGSTITVIDNIERPIKSDVLCTVLTEPLIRDRVLGSTRTVSVPTTTTWIATGNNIRVDGDLTSRCLLCRLDPACERPEERAFTINLHETVPRDRGELCVAILTIVRGYVAAYQPDLGLTTYGRFEDWSLLVRAPLVWLGMVDPCDTRREIERSDSVHDALSHLLDAWFAVFGEQIHPVSEIVALINSDMIGAYEELRQAVTNVAGERNGVNTHKLGKFIAKYEKRIENGLRFEKFNDDERRVALWRVHRN